MKARFKIGLGLFALAISGSIFTPLVSRGQPATVDEIRRDYHQQGFKTDLSDFNFTVSKEMNDRAAALTNKDRVNMLQPTTFLDNADLLTPVGDGRLAIVIWKQDALAYPLGFRGYSYLYDPGSDKDVWPAQRGVMEDSREKMDAAAGAVLSGPYGFDLNASRGLYMLLPHLADLKRFTQMFAGRAVLDLHDGEPDAAWTNLLAATRIVTAWQIEPTEISQYVRFDCLETVYDMTWQALHTNWSDAPLARLQRELESLDPLKPLPDTVAFMGASYIGALHQGIKTPVADAEKNLLLFYHNRELETRRAVQSESWSQIQHMPDVTNVFFVLPTGVNLPPVLSARMNLFQVGMARSGRGIGLIARAAEAETRRRLLIMAIALERYHLQHDSYPKTLDTLAPDFVKTPLLDFMDGQPFHYSVNSDGHFLLYSVGLNGKDDGGKMPPAPEELPVMFTHPDPDIVWPLPASTAMATAHAAEEGRRLEEVLAADKKRGEEQEAETVAMRRSAAKELLSNPKYKKTTWTGELQSEGGELIYRNQPLVKFLRNEKSTGTNSLSLDELLTLKPVEGVGGPQALVYQLPIAYDHLTNLFGASLDLLMDSPPGDNFDGQPEYSDWKRATNGDSLLIWYPVWERPEPHAMQAWLMLSTGNDHFLEMKGPVLPFLSTNLIQFSPYASMFDEKGADLTARVAESNATFSIEIKTPSGDHLKTLTGTTTNGLIHVEWNLIDDKGNKFTNDSFDAEYQVTVSSNRSQTLPRGQIRVGTHRN